MARKLATSFSAFGFSVLVCTLLVGQTPVRIAGFDLPEFSTDHQATWANESETKSNRGWDHDRLPCMFDVSHSAARSSDDLNRESSTKIRPPARMLSRSSYACPFGSPSGIDEAVSGSRPLPTVSTTQASTSSPSKASTALIDSDLSNMLLTLVDGVAPVKATWLKSAFEFATASEEQLAESRSTSGLIPDRSNTDKDEYWQYYSDCDRWNVVFQRVPASAFSRIPDTGQVQFRPTQPSETAIDEISIEQESEVFDSPAPISTLPAKPVATFSVARHISLWLALGGRGVNQLGAGINRVYRQIEFHLVETPVNYVAETRIRPVFVSFAIRSLLVRLNQLINSKEGLIARFKAEYRMTKRSITESPVIPYLAEARRELVLSFIEQKLENERKREALGRYVAPRLKWTGDKLQQIGSWIEASVHEQTAENQEPTAQLK